MNHVQLIDLKENDVKKIIVMIAISLLPFTASLAQSSNIHSLPELVQYWGKGLSKSIAWEAGDQYTGRMVELDQIVDTSTVQGFESALNLLNSLLARANATPLIACVYKDTIVIRRIDQPACGKAL